MKFMIHLQLTDEELGALLWVLHDADINNMSNKPTAKRAALRKTINTLEQQQGYRAQVKEFLAWRKAKVRQNKRDVANARHAIAEYESTEAIKEMLSEKPSNEVIDVTQHNSPKPRWKPLKVYSTAPNKDKK